MSNTVPRKSSFRSRACYNCHEIGHFSKQCPNPKKADSANNRKASEGDVNLPSVQQVQPDNHQNEKRPKNRPKYKKDFKKPLVLCPTCSQSGHPVDKCPYSENDARTVKQFSELLRQDENQSMAAVAMRILFDFIDTNTSCNTVQELSDSLRNASAAMQSIRDADASLSCGCELLMRFITLTSSMDQSDFGECRKVLLDRGQRFLEYVSRARESVASQACDFLPSLGFTCIVFGYSRVVMHTLRRLHQTGRNVCCLVVCQKWECTKVRDNLAECFNHNNSPNQSPRMELQFICQEEVSIYISAVDCLLLGAEAFCQSGGIINRLGTHNLALIAKQFNKPVYALLEFFKFSHLAPLRTEDLPKEILYGSSEEKTNGNKLHYKRRPRVDYTEHSLIDMIICDRGVIPPEVATFEIIKLYT